MDWDIQCDEDSDEAGRSWLRYSIPVSVFFLQSKGVYLSASKLPRNSDDDEPDAFLCIAREFDGSSVETVAGVLGRNGAWILRKAADHPTGAKLTGLFLKLAGDEANRIRERLDEARESMREIDLPPSVPSSGALVQPVVEVVSVPEIETEAASSPPNSTPPIRRSRKKAVPERSVPAAPQAVSPSVPAPERRSPKIRKPKSDGQMSLFEF